MHKFLIFPLLRLKIPFHFLVHHCKCSFLPARCLPSWEQRSRVPYTFQALEVNQEFKITVYAYLLDFFCSKAGQEDQHCRQEEATSSFQAGCACPHS